MTPYARPRELWVNVDPFRKASILTLASHYRTINSLWIIALNTKGKITMYLKENIREPDLGTDQNKTADQIEK